MQQSSDPEIQQTAMQRFRLDALDRLQRLNRKQPALSGKADTPQSGFEMANELRQAGAQDVALPVIDGESPLRGADAGEGRRAAVNPSRAENSQSSI